MLKDLTPPKKIPEEKNLNDRMLALFEKSAPDAFAVMESLLLDRFAETRFKAAKYILDKTTPEKFNDPFAFLSRKTKEELIALIAGSALFDNGKLKDFGGAVEAEVVKPQPGAIGRDSSGNTANSGTDTAAQL